MERSFRLGSGKRKNSEGRDPRTFTEPVERWSVQEKRKESGRKRRKRKRRRRIQKKKKKKKLVEEVPRKGGKSRYGREERRRERKGRQKERQTPRWKMALFPIAVGAELVVCPCCSGRTAEKDGDDGKDAAAGGFR